MRCREARGLGFLEFADERDAADAVRGLDRMVLGGREVRVMLCDTAAMTSAMAAAAGQHHRQPMPLKSFS
jgi:hypothetical protein